ncbi:MAG: hypothetical protein M1115_05255 [Actinobacteria bacterium]|nr:hypothetical protein [Actinomycetota bacterium]
MLFKVTSVVIYTNRSRVVFTGTMPVLEAAYRKVLWHNLLAGWWGIPFGLIWTPLSLLKNRAALRKLRQQAAPPPQGA